MTNGIRKGTLALLVEAKDWEEVKYDKRSECEMYTHRTVLSACADQTMSPWYCSTILHMEICSTVLQYCTNPLECSVGTVPSAGSYIRVTTRIHTTAKWWSQFKKGEQNHNTNTELTKITPMRWWWSRGGVQKKRGGNGNVWRECEVCFWRWQVVCIFCQTTTRLLKNAWNNVVLTNS